MRALTYSFWTFVVGWLLLFPFASAALETRFGAIGILGIALLVTGGCSYIIALGIVARDMGKSWITWVGLTLITSPFGFLVSYAMAVRLIPDPSADQTASRRASVRS